MKLDVLVDLNRYTLPANFEKMHEIWKKCDEIGSVEIFVDMNTVGYIQLD